MEFGPVPLAQALGAVLAHSVALAQGRLRKGKVLGADDLAALAGAGHVQITVARLAQDDIPEDDAALAIANALVPDAARAGLSLRAVGTGRVNIHADAVGLAEIDASRIQAMNRVDPMITLATVPPWQRMAAGGMMATVKIIAYGVSQASVTRACAALGPGGLALRRVVLRRAVLIETEVGAASPGKGYGAMQKRLAALGMGLAPRQLVAHRIDALVAALQAVQGADLIMVLTGSATSDPRDVAPEALRVAGGRVAHFGMPVDPGNLLFIGDLRGVPVIGLPGCARSPALNGADFVLERLACGVPVTGDDIMAMGVGGLLKEIPTRPQPREAPPV